MAWLCHSGVLHKYYRSAWHHLCLKHTITDPPLTCRKGVERRKRSSHVTITTSVMTQAVVSSEQVQRCVQVRVDLVDPVADRFQGHPPVRGLRLTRDSSDTEQSQQENTYDTAGQHGPLHNGLIWKGLFLHTWSRWHLTFHFCLFLFSSCLHFTCRSWVLSSGFGVVTWQPTNQWGWWLELQRH